MNVALSAVTPADLIAALSQPQAYPHPVDAVEVVQTHISIVFLTEERVYKLKKTLDLGFLDYSTPERRHACCQAEVELNRRLAPHVYLGVVPITRDSQGQVRVDGTGATVEYAVVMRRLPADRTFKALLAAGDLSEELISRFAERLARFHQAAERTPKIARFGEFDVVAGNCRENFTQLRQFVGETVHPAVLERLSALTEDALLMWRPLIEARAAGGLPCDCHGDLRLEHVYHLPDPEAPDDLVVVDCIEFNERFRYSDPIADLAFTYMELRRSRRPDLAHRLVQTYLHGADDAQGAALLPFYSAYRAVVRGKVGSFKAAEGEVEASERAHASERARGHLLFALGELAPPAERPRLVVVGGLPCSGKSTLAQALHDDAGFTWIRADAVRKELAGLAPSDPASAPLDRGIYTPPWSQVTYNECLRRAEAALFEGKRVVVDACFNESGRRQRFLHAAQRWAVPFHFLHCELSPERTRERLAARAHTADPSDADWGVYEALRDRWEPLTPDVLAHTTRVDTTAPAQEVARTIERALGVSQA